MPPAMHAPDTVILSDSSARAHAHARLPSLAAHEIARFWNDGHLHLPAIADRVEVERLIPIYDRVFAAQAGFACGDFFDFAGRNDGDPALPQILQFSRYAPEFQHTALWRDVEAAARCLLGPDAVFLFDHAMVKQPHAPATPWHQDQAFNPSGARYDFVTFWIPLQDVDRDSGCLKFVSGSHAGPLLPHQPIGGNPRAHGLEALGVDETAAVYAPLAGGGCTVHHRLTLHGADANSVATPRRAWGIVYGVRTARPLVTHEYSWNRRRSTDRARRSRHALPAWPRWKRTVRHMLVLLGMI
jgi:ectoine hydroxylase-related dioxygenase (phytanoyl-CoA dioxygenase family)